MRNIIALEAKTGKTLWKLEYKIDGNEAKKRLPLNPSISSHIHGINYINGWLLQTGLDCSVRAIDAKTGKEVWVIKDICLNVPGNSYDWLTYKGPGLYGLPGHPGTIYKNIYVDRKSVV